MYWEEVALGYDAYSLLKTGKDHRGNPWPIVYLASYMDFKPPLYVYSLIPSIKLFGLNELGVRFPSAFFGTLTVLAIYFLVKELFSYKNKKPKYLILNTDYLPLIASLLMAISPWHLQFSRAAFEANLALFMVVLAVFLFLKSLKKSFCLPLSAVCFALSIYAYHGARIFSPLLVILLATVYFKKLWQHKFMGLIGLILGLVICLPFLKSFTDVTVRQRFQETSAFATLDPIIESNQKISQDNYSLASRLIHHRYLEYARIFLNNYFTYFNANYLFLSGDENPRHSTQEFGQLYHWELVTVVLGVIFLVKNIKQKSSLLVLGWLLISFIPGAITKTNPHCLRTILGLPAFIIISSLGLTWLISRTKNKVFLFSVFCFLFLELLLYLHFYYHHYPKIYSDQWQYGYKQAILDIREKVNNYDYIYLTDQYGRSYMYYLFFSKHDPVETQKLMEPYKTNPNVAELGKVIIGDPQVKEANSLIIGGPEIIQTNLLETINFLDGQPAFKIWEKLN